jgi:hypothetical protein
VRRVVVLALILAACATGQRPGTGDLSFRVSWNGEADVDLYVESPLREPINYAVPSSNSGGRLDIDCNFHGVRMCEAPMENIFWPAGTAPPGIYRFWILLPDAAGMQPADEYRLEVRRGRTVIWSRRGRVAELATAIPVMEVHFPTAVVRSGVADAEPP